MKILFMGTPDFAVPSLKGLVEAGYEVCGVFTQPDKPKNRGMKLQPTPVKEFAMTQNIPVFQPVTLKDAAVIEQIRALDPTLIVVAAYGRILPETVLQIPPMGCINVHSSLLPKYRGAAPINWAVICGEQETGVTIMYMAKELDAGDIIAQQSTPIDPEETVETLHDRLAGIGGQLLVNTVKQMEQGTAKRVPQDPALVTYAPMLSRALSPIDWRKSAHEIHNQVRGLTPWPGSTTQIINGKPMKIITVTETGEKTCTEAGTIVSAGEAGIDIACGDGRVLRVLELQAEGKRRMPAADYLRGNPITLR